MAILRILAILLTALILVPSGAHLLEFPAKIGLDRDTYFAVQQIYAGWALSGAAIIAALVANAALVVGLRRQDRTAARAAGVAAVLIGVSLAVFFVWTFPANQATANWTVQPDDWKRLRRDWEVSHAANAGIVFAALVATTIAAVRRP